MARASDFEDQRRELLAERERLRRRIRAIDRFLEAQEEIRRTALDAETDAREASARTSLAEPPATADVLAGALTQAARSMSLAELTDIVLARGLLGASPNPRAAVRVALTRMVEDGSAVKVARGEWISPERSSP